MIRLLAALLGAAIGAALGYAFDYPILGAAIGLAIGYTMSYSTDVAFNRPQKRELAQGVDAINLVYWIAGPALKELAEAREDWFESYEIEVRKAMISQVVLEHVMNEADIVVLGRQFTRIGTTPFATIRRHNRAHQPRAWKKVTLTHEVLRRSAYLLVEGGMTEPAFVWYLHASKMLKINPNEAAQLLFEQMDEMKERRSMLAASSYDVSPLDQAADGIEPPKGIDSLLELFRAERAMLYRTLGVALNVG